VGIINLDAHLDLRFAERQLRDAVPPAGAGV
jgi:arginase family enzyme